MHYKFAAASEKQRGTGQMPILTFRGEARCKKLGPSEMSPALFHRQPPKKPPISGEMRPIPTQGVS